MKKLTDIDMNLKIETNIDEKDIVFFDASEPPFDLYGLMKDGDCDFTRMPQEIAKTVNEGVEALNVNAAGGRLRFKTNSRYVAIKVMMKEAYVFPHMALAGSSGFDLYEKNPDGYAYRATFLPDWDIRNFLSDKAFENITYFEDKGMKDLTLNFPLYNGVEKLYIGLEKGSALESGGKYSDEKPIVFYGSSITQGACASRPGNAYSNMISRRYDIDTVNLGFSGSGRGEKEIAEYIAGLDMSVFVYDYDHNAPNAEHLRKTHKPMFDIIRKAHPNVPVIMLSKPQLFLNEADTERKNIIYATYEEAKENGDENVYFIPGDGIFKIHGGDSCTEDGCHPNDLGFMCMADAISRVLDGIFG